MQLPTSSVDEHRCERLVFVKRSTAASLPVRATPFSAGVDLASAVECTIPAWGREIVKTDLSCQLPRGCYGRIAPRSGLARKSAIDVAAGVIDADYRGPLDVLLVNMSPMDYQGLILERGST